jgi:4-amino-4-deoxy-L-arabinose transferase-like glycosyltransferase
MTGEQVYVPLKAVSRGQKSYRVLVGVVVLLAVGLMIYAQTDAFVWDEGWHLLAAQSITRGKRLYLDFNYSQTPLNAYWNAFWFSVFGTTWRTAHAIAALMTSGAIMLTADYVFVRFPVARWRATAAIMTALLMGLNVLIVQYGVIGQAYGLALFLVVAAFRATVLAVERKNVVLPALAGFLSSAAAGATLLSAPVCPVLAIWMVVQNRVGNRWAQLSAFAAAAVVPFLPVAYLFSKGPRQTLFDIIQYNLLFRQVDWPDAIPHDFDVMFAWLNSAQALLAGLLALAGLLFIRFRGDWPRAQRAEFYLCGWLALALGIHISSAHPTFQRYYLLAYPFVIILATAGLYFVGPRLVGPDRPLWPMVALSAIFSLELAKALHNKHANVNWFDLQKIAAKVDEVTPRNGTLLSDEPIYFLTRRPPPHGMELADSHKLEFPPERAIPLNLVPESEVLRQVKAGRFETVVNCDKNERLTDEDLEKVYQQKFKNDTCDVFWNFKQAR